MPSFFICRDVGLLRGLRRGSATDEGRTVERWLATLGVDGDWEIAQSQEPSSPELTCVYVMRRVPLCTPMATFADVS